MLSANASQVLKSMYDGLMNTQSGDPVYVKFDLEKEMEQIGFSIQEKNIVLNELQSLGYIKRFTMHNFSITNIGILAAQNI